MADVASSSISILRFILDCINNVQLAREFEDEFERCQLKLDILQIRLSRWGEAVGLIHSDGTQPTADGGAVGSKHISRNQEKTEGDKAQQTLISIQDTLERVQKAQKNAERSLKKMKAGLVADESANQTLDPNNMPMYVKRIRTQFDKFLQKRKTQTIKALDSVKWVMYKKSHFDKLIEDISGFAGDLESLLTEEEKQKLRDLSKEECNGLNTPNLEEVKDVAEGCDPWLEDTAAEVLNSTRAASTYSITQSRNVGMVTGVHHGDINGVSNGSDNTTNNYWDKRK